MHKKADRNSRFAKAGVSYFYDNGVLDSSFAHQMKFSAEKTPTSQSGKTLAATLKRNLKNERT